MSSFSPLIRCFVLASFLIPATVGAARAEPPAGPVQFARDVLPVLSANCFTCHGPDDKERKAKLRLDQRESALRPAESGETAIVPKEPNKSDLVRRILATSADERMPPAKSGRVLKEHEKELLRRWIAEGAEYQPHWSFVPPKKAPPPAVKLSGWARNPLDRFVLARLEAEGLSPTAEADRYTLARRVAIDLTGLPPTMADADAFAADPSPDAYERYVDRVLASPALGERWAHVWLDLARYADSNGYANDSPRSIWKYRDWVIQAYNRNLPFDQFTIEQLAGDMLPDPKQDQLIATAFHRNTLTNDEGGTSDEEFRTAAVVDRVNTTFQVYMGLTMQCAECHSHKYDPLSQTDYFRIYAIFNQSEDADRNDNSPNLNTPTPDELRQSERLKAEIARLEAVVAEQAKKPDATEPKTSPPKTGPLLTRFVRVESLHKAAFLHLAEVEAFVGNENVARKGKATQISTDYGGPPELAIDGKTDGVFEHKSVSHTGQADDPWWEVDLGTPQPLEKIVVWNRTDPTVVERLKNWRIVALDEKRQPLWVRHVHEAPNPKLEAPLPKTAETLDAAAKKEIAAYRKADAAKALAPEAKRLEEAKKELAGLKGVPTPIMRELSAAARRKTHVLIRGNFLDQGAEVQPGLPVAFPPLPAGQEPTRLNLARWLLDPSNPLTARVTVNRFWEQIFGQGLVETPEDWGIRGRPSTHPELLDYLATEFREQGWNVKQLLRSIVTSATYRQSSAASAALVERDPDNKLFARGPRFRSSAEVIRDQTLAAVGLLRPKQYGPPVRPERPKMRLSAAFGGATDWETSPGEDRYRRALYTEWRRTAPYPSMVTFDAPNRTVCTIRRPRTNTPLQALVTLNDPVYVEAAQALARQVMSGGSTPDARAALAVRLAVTRPARPEEVSRLVKLYQETKESFAKNPTGAKTLASKPLGELPAGVDPIEAAAWTVVSNVVLNLDEFFAKR